MTATNTIDAYCQAWNCEDPLQRAPLLAASTTEGVEYVDPTVVLRGRQELSLHIDSVFARYPRSRIERTSSIDRHHHWARFLWRKVLADGTPLAESLDVVELSPDGRACRIIGFFGAVRPFA